MVRILQYDPRITAAAYSQRRAAEEGFDSGVATGLARLGRALSGREEGFRRAGAGAMAVQQAMGFWDDEVRRLDELGAKIPPGKPGFHDLALKEHLARRTETIARLKEADPEQAALFDLRTRPLVETLERRATAMEADAAGRTLSAGMGGALAMAAKTVRADPLQHDAIRDGLAETLSEMERDGVDAEALARVRASADRSLAMAAIGGLIDDGQFDAARELLAEGRMPGLTPEDRREQERLVGRAERRAGAIDTAEEAAAEDAYWAGFQSLATGLREGGEAPDLRYTDESIRAALPQEQAEKMIALRDEAEDAGDAYARIALASPEAVQSMIRDAGPEEARRLRAAAREREGRLAEDPAAFVLGNGRVRSAHDAWQTALAGDDPETIANTARAYAQASLDQQRRLGVAEADRRVLPAESAAAMVTEFAAAERPDPAALGAELRARFAEHWRPVLEDLRAAGLPEGMAAIAAMDRPEQRAAAQRLSGLVGTPTSALRAAIDEEAARAVDESLRSDAGGQAGPPFAGPDVDGAGAEAELARRLAYDNVHKGEHPVSAVRNAIGRTVKQADPISGAGTAGAPDPEAEPYSPQKLQEIEGLFADLSVMGEADLDPMLERIRQVFGDVPEFAALIGSQVRNIATDAKDSATSVEGSRRGLDMLRRRLVGEDGAGGWDYHQHPGQGRLRETEAAMRQLAEENRTRFPRGAANLERFLDGDGGTELYDPDELLSFPPVQAAESENEIRFEDWMLGVLKVVDPTHEVHSKLNAMADGDTFPSGTDWDAIGAFGISEPERDLHLAIGGFNLKSDGKFEFTRDGDVIHVRGTIIHYWSDIYDWKPGDMTFIPTMTMPLIVHDDMLALRDFGDAEFFTSLSAWRKEVTGTLTISNGVVASADLDMVDNGWRPRDAGEAMPGAPQGR